jgi:hypothetical protein
MALSPALFVDRHNVHLPNMYSVSLMISICARIMADLPDDHPHTQKLVLFISAFVSRLLRCIE